MCIYNTNIYIIQCKYIHTYTTSRLSSIANLGVSVKYNILRRKVAHKVKSYTVYMYCTQKLSTRFKKIYYPGMFHKLPACKNCLLYRIVIDELHGFNSNYLKEYVSISESGLVSYSRLIKYRLQSFQFGCSIRLLQISISQHSSNFICQRGTIHQLTKGKPPETWRCCVCSLIQRLLFEAVGGIGKYVIQRQINKLIFLTYINKYIL